MGNGRASLFVGRRKQVERWLGELGDRLHVLGIDADAGGEEGDE